MANNYIDIMKIVNQGNKMGLSNTITRDNGIPLDLSSVQQSYEAAVIYAATKAIAYVGQPVAVGDKLYIISDTAAEEKFVAADGKEYDNFLKEVGSKTNGDTVTIDLEAGVLKLHGFEDALAGYIPQKKAIYKEGSETEIDHYELEWVAISAIVEGDGNKVTTLTSEDGSVKIEKKTDTDESLVYDLSVTHPDIPEYAIKKDERAEGATETKYHLTKDGNNVDVEIVVPDAYDDTALANRVEAVENKFDIGDKTVKEYVGEQISNAEVGKLTKVIADSVDLENNNVTIEGTVETPVEHVIYMVKVTGATGDSYKEYMLIGGTLVQTGDTTTDLSDYAKTADVVAKTDFETFQENNTQAISDARSGAVADVEAKGYALAADVERDYAKKATTLAGYGITDAYTKTEIDNKIGQPGVPAVKDAEGNITTDAVDGTGIFANAYSKAEVNALLDEVSGGSSETAASVKRQLDEYKTANNERVAAIETQVGKDVNGAEPATGLFLEVDEARKQADKGVADAKTANDAIAALTTGAVAQNTSDISNLKGRVGTLESAKTDHETRIGANETAIKALQDQDATINGKLGGIETQIAALVSEDTKLSGAIAANTEAINKKASQDDLTALANKIGTVPADTTIVAMIAKAQEDATYDDTKVKEDIAANKTAIEKIYRAGEGEAAATGLLAEEIARAKAAEKDLDDAIKLLTNGAGTDEIDSVKELIDYVNNHGATVEGINDRLDGHDTILAGIGGEDQPATVMAAIQAAAYTLPAATADILGGVKSAVANADGQYAANAVVVGTDARMTVHSISTDTLVNGVEEFILYGGNAGVED